MASAPPLTREEHRGRAERHAQVGRALADAGDEWSAVLFFYAAYHLAKAALLDDSTFDSEAACRAKHPDLCPEDRYATSHRGRKVPRGTVHRLGVTELVQILYPGVIGPYDRLHQMSMQVRYGKGLVGSIENVVTTWERFAGLEASGALTSGPGA